MADMTVGQSVTASGQTGDRIYFSLTIPSPGKYVLQVAGMPTQAGIWGPFPPGITPVDGPPYGDVAACGANAWSVHTFKAGTYLVRAIPKATGSATLLLRSWTFFDYFLMWRHPSTC